MTWCSPRLTSSPKTVIFKHLYEHFCEQLPRHGKRFSITRSSTFPTKNDVGISRVCSLGPPPKQQEHVWSVSAQSNSYMEIIITLIKLIRSFQNNKVIRLTIKVIVNMHNHLPSSCKIDKCDPYTRTWLLHDPFMRAKLISLHKLLCCSI